MRGGVGGKLWDGALLMHLIGLLGEVFTFS